MEARHSASPDKVRSVPEKPAANFCQACRRWSLYQVSNCAALRQELGAVVDAFFHLAEEAVDGALAGQGESGGDHGQRLAGCLRAGAAPPQKVCTVTGFKTGSVSGKPVSHVSARS
jgi:hypothetical protein